jgi:hypothetical protein
VRIHVLTDPARGSAGGYTEHELVTLTLTPNEARDLAEALSLLPEGAAAEPPPPTLEERLAAQPDVLAEHDAGYSHAVTVVTWFTAGSVEDARTVLADHPRWRERLTSQ